MSLYNTIIRTRSDIEYLTSKRRDLIPPIIAGNAGNTPDTTAGILLKDYIHPQLSTNDEVQDRLFTMTGSAEQVPELMPSRDYLDLQREITKIDHQISQKMRFYTDSVKLFNSTLHTLPGRCIGLLFRFREMESPMLSESGEDT